MATDTVVAAVGSSSKNEDAPSGTLRWDLNVPKWKGRKRSENFEVNGIPWYVTADKVGEHLALFLYGIENGSVIWSIKVAAQFSIVNENKAKNLERKFSVIFNYSTPGQGYSQFILWKDLCDESKGFMKDSKFTIEAFITLTTIMGIRRVPRFDFTNPNDQGQNLTLLIGDNKLYVNKEFLSVHSTVFHTLFNETNKNARVVEIKDVLYADFLDMLNFIYPSGSKVTDSNAEGLLILGLRYQIHIIISAVEKFLKETLNLSLAAKLKLSDKHALVDLQGDCLSKLKSVEKVTALKHTEEYKHYSESLKKALFETIMKVAT